ncbi:MAG: rhodanese-like domain-containing protein [Enterocloster sp.]
MGQRSETAAAAQSDGSYQYVSPKEAVAAAKDKSAHVLDVREWDNYVKGRVADSMWCPIFPLEDDSLAEAMGTYAKENLSDGQKIYIICNSGKRGAERQPVFLRRPALTVP